jgi:probable rRNA maturation factor
LKPKIYYDLTRFRLKESRSVLNMIEKVIRKENKIPGDLNFIITADEPIRAINKEFLGHDYYTDVIAFDESEGNKVNGEIYISIDTVKRNAVVYKVNLREELIRVMIHGTLHLCGYDDKTEVERDIMISKGENWIVKLK